MQKFFLNLLILLTLVGLLGACSAPTPPPTVIDLPTAVTELPTQTPMLEATTLPAEPTVAQAATEMPTATAEMPTTQPTEPAAVDLPAWFSQPLTDVQTGETFTLQELQGKVVLVETMAMWCPNCKTQQNEVKALHELLGHNPDLISIALDVDINESADSLKQYAVANGFDWRYVVATPEIAREIGNLYGAQFLNPPSTPIFLIDRAGNVQLLPFGIKSASELQTFVETLLNGG
ncbi:MAG TPA: redoxin domain-containing protein [Anaerolineales bacterium]|nr:redoxin domain-containing protein [Anaerolineales bacterium]